MTKTKHTLPKGVTSEIINNAEQATTTISVQAPYDFLEKNYDAAFKRLSKGVKADGFRPGKVPTDVAAAKLPEIMILDEAGRELISELYPTLLDIHDIDGIGQPQIQVTKLAKGNPFEFTITIAKVPTVDIADYIKIKNNLDKTAIDPKVSNDELDTAIEALRQQWAQQEKYQEIAAKDPEAAKTTDPRQIKIKDDELPTVDDSWVAKLGDYKTVADFKNAFKLNIKTNKASQELDKRRAEGLDKIISESSFTVPEVVYLAERDRLFELRQAEIKQAGLKFGDYLKAIQKTEAQMRESMIEEAKQHVHSQMVIQKIAESEKLFPSADIVKTEVDHLKKMYPDANDNNLRAYVDSQLTTRAVLTWITAGSNDKAKADNKKKAPSKKEPTKDKKSPSKDTKVKTSKKSVKKDKK